ncbi:MAG: SRPBCC family protein [Candidatus Dormibacteria bacterium]
MSGLMHPRYVATVQSSWAAERVLRYMADFRNAVHWDPSVQRAVLAGGDGESLGSTFDLVVRVGKRVSELRYVISSLTPDSVELTARTRSLESIDTITVRPDPDGGSSMEYDARLTFVGVARLANPILARTFRTLGDNARASLNEKLNA